ncbi:MAG: ATP-binding protein [Clostridiales bacterium]|nr:ATP-binding protein [Clostridiales bacterium]
MGTYLNCGNEAFRQICSGIYVDKTNLIRYINSTIGTSANLTCFSRPRRFGKSFAAVMLSAYYDKSCDSGDLFDSLAISRADTYEKYRNQFDVIYLDITWFISRARTKRTPMIVSAIQAAVIEELKKAFPGCIDESEEYLPDALIRISQQTKEKFFIIIDEWDALFREAKENEELQKSYIQFLRGMFKAGPAMKSAIAGAYMTGILPIKKYGTESALTDFREFTMAKPLKLAEYVGFTEDEVQKLCAEHHLDFEGMQKWYDGYSFSRIKHLYNPNSVINAIANEELGSYWTKSETYESLRQYISMNFDGLKDAIIQMLGGQRISVDVNTFQNDMTTFNCRDDVLTLLIHLGYLAYDERNSEVYIPNLEVADAFKSAVKGTSWSEINQLLSQSESLLKATIKKDSETVANALELSHESCTSILEYNDENSLSCAIMLAYYTARNYYEIVREFPSGKGFADLVFIPRKNTDKPAMIIELKYNKSAESAIQQIKDKRYTGRMQDYTGNLLLVGINYDKNAGSKKHTCIIEEL